MATIAALTSAEKITLNSHKFAFTLSPTNYGYWKSMIEPFLVSNNLFGYVDGTIPCPSKTVTSGTTTSDNPSYPHWIANDAHVRMLITSTISEAAFQHVQGQTSREVWLSLERAYAPNTSSREYTLKTQLLRIMMKGDETPTAYLTRAQEYAIALANIGEPMKDKDLVMLVISGLKEEYNGLKSNLLARHPPITFNELYGLLHDHDYMINTNNSSSPAAIPAQAFVATASPSPPNISAIQSQLNSLQLLAGQLGYQLSPIASSNQPQASYASRSINNNRGNRRGNYRGNSRGNSNNRNRDSRDTNSSRQFSWASTQNMVYGHCNRCGIGHLPSQCPNQPGSSKQPTQANFANFSDAGSTLGSSWFPDTGANSHAAPDLSSLDNSEVYQGRVYTHYPPHGPK
ncbi:hypothetical protein QVD17_11217 [Tagetes erecta]|uniref:Retrotransposon Copia-like N-terminal domain-containing protein n=1 Tax=Tagetes erecta TaxID=13708 RepID=A0AAD8P0M7_TARER|nr:hypothetical protein QVD17_11217 [Tagetes erecta]